MNRRNSRLGTQLIHAFLFLLLSSPSLALAKREHLVHFPNTAYELNIFRISGKKPGPTLMLIGGIQGNEPGGFLSADLYADMSLEKGNLIVVPRANFNSIISNQRGVNGDMNRKFTPEVITSSMEDKIVTILKKLISESDYLLNLHDGSGYYYPKYVDHWRNPMRFGQCIIADCEEYHIPSGAKVIKLGEMARKVIEEVNPHIPNSLHQFHFNNTKTSDRDSPHREQMRSATYYALTRHNIPAFGVETSKHLPSIDLKVQYHNLVINAFMKLFGIVPESPGLNLQPPLLKYLVVSINGQTPIVIEPNQQIVLQSGDSINVTHIEANYERGLSVDFIGHGGLNDLRKDFTIVKDTSLIVRRDNQTFAEIPIRVSGKRPVDAPTPRKVEYFVIEAKGQRILLAAGETLDLVSGDSLKIVDVMPSLPVTSKTKVNFKGFVGDLKNNTGEDRGYLIDTSTDLIDRFSLQGKGNSYEIVVTEGEAVIGRAVVRLSPPKMNYLILKVNGQKYHYVKPEDVVFLSLEDTVCVEEVRANLHNPQGVSLNVNGHSLKSGDEVPVKKLFPSSKPSTYAAKIEHRSALLGKITVKVN
jgi:hypothetical protein